MQTGNKNIWLRFASFAFRLLDMKQMSGSEAELHFLPVCLRDCPGMQKVHAASAILLRQQTANSITASAKSKPFPSTWRWSDSKELQNENDCQSKEMCSLSSGYLELKSL